MPAKEQTMKGRLEGDGNDGNVVKMLLGKRRKEKERERSICDAIERDEKQGYGE